MSKSCADQTCQHIACACTGELRIARVVHHRGVVLGCDDGARTFECHHSAGVSDQRLCRLEALGLNGGCGLAQQSGGFKWVRCDDGDLPFRARCRNRVSSWVSLAMALSASASRTKRGATDSARASQGAMSCPPPHPHTTVALSKGSMAGSRVIKAGWLTCVALSKSPKYTRPAPPCSAAVAAKIAAPCMPLAPPKMATSPRLPLWLLCAAVARSGS